MWNLKLRGERASILADALLAVPSSPSQQRSLEAAPGFFLTLKTKKALRRAALLLVHPSAGQACQHPAAPHPGLGV
ncbi:hypothetical protein DAETH_36100 (plasmid) [Deinococcus aetherius]|uniref:Uncharacterized protein n=1 Tax=Deinococcus aetherius TaxID=200252 RepID=A0ABN6RMS6_9DEIO|nr:hypothetical protein DAETH_36100 [Deinococcus aetherius]